jgi:hypothetical protein
MSISPICGKAPDLPDKKVEPVADNRVPQIMKQVIEKKRALLEEKSQERFKGSNMAKEAIYITSDVATAGFSIVQGISLLTPPNAGLALVGSISGLIGSVLNIGQGLFLLTEALQAFKNGQHKQGSRLAADALLLIGIGAIMLLVSLSVLGVKLGAVASIAANPYLMPVFFLALVLPGLIQTVSHLIKVAQGTDVGSKLLDPKKQQAFAKAQNNLLLQSKNLPEAISSLMEQYTEELGVEAGIEAMELLRKFLEKQEDIRDQMELFQKKVQEWNRIVKLRTVQLSLYSLSFPLGLASVFSGASKVISAVSKFFLTAPSSAGAYMDACEPFKRNGAITVPKV